MSNNWGVIDDPRVKQVARRAARSLARDNQGFLEEDDLYQEALIFIATKSDLTALAMQRNYALLYNGVRMDLLNGFVTPLLRTGEMEQRKYKTVSTEDADEFVSPFVHLDDGTGDYTEDAVRLLLPAVWDESYAYSLPDRDDAPDKDMPKSASNKARSNNHWAYIADIKTGWNKTPLTLDERRALLLYFGMGWTQRDIAFNQDTSQQTVSNRLDSGVKKITARLNGASLSEEN